MATMTEEPELNEITSVELRRMTHVERDAILTLAAERACDDYCGDKNLTDFEVY